MPGPPVADQYRLSAAATAWVAERNRAQTKINWTFRVADARKKLAHLYPQNPQR